MLLLACFKVGRYLEPKINLFYALKYKYFITNGPTNTPTKLGYWWEHDCRVVSHVEKLIHRLVACALDITYDEEGR